MTKTKIKLAIFDKISLAISLAKVWQKKFRVLTVNTLFSVIYKMEDEDLLMICRLYHISVHQELPTIEEGDEESDS